MGRFDIFFRDAVDKGGVLAFGVGSLILSQKRYSPVWGPVSCAIITFGALGFARYILVDFRKRPKENRLKEPNFEEVKKESQEGGNVDIVKLIQGKLDREADLEAHNLIEKYFPGYEKCLEAENLSEDESEMYEDYELGIYDDYDLGMREEDEMEVIGDDDLRIYIEAAKKEMCGNNRKNTEMLDEYITIPTHSL